MFMQFSARSGDQGMRAFVGMLPSGVRYWTVLDEELAVVPVADAFLRQVRFGRDGAESTTKAYAGGLALFLRWCARTGRGWQGGGGGVGCVVVVWWGRGRRGGGGGGGGGGFFGGRRCGGGRVRRRPGQRGG